MRTPHTGKAQAVAHFGWDNVPILSTPRLALRTLTAADSADLFIIYGDAAVMAFTSDPAFPDPPTLTRCWRAWRIALPNVRRLSGTSACETKGKASALAACTGS